MRNSIVVLIFIVSTSFDLSAKTSDLKGECKPKDWICILTRNENDKVEFYIQNQTPSGEYPFIIHFDFTTLDNFESDVPVPYRFISKGSSEPKKFLTISPIDVHKGRSYNSNIYVKAGDDSHQTSNLPYRLPFESSSRVGQGYNGKFTHTGIFAYALDFTLSEGSPVLAAREGLVIAIQDKYRSGGTTSYYKDKANFIQILHKDGSIAEYAHLKHKGVLVQIGQVVQTGERIGFSGNTGFSNAPHLHFHVLTHRQNLQSVPISFKTDEGLLDELKEGAVYWNPSNLLPAGKIFFEEDLKICSEFIQKKLSECEEKFNPQKRPILALEVRKPGKYDLKVEVCNPDSICKRIDWTLQPEWKSSVSYFDWSLFPGQPGKYKIQVINDIEIIKTWIVERY
ncbi:M23 family metallopeptidase [Leptospira santarosai]|uniref:Peptidase M23 n=1 Tax=Leptospira santarosai serovar Shermani str. LT 821 TaxID=758847 RepID=K8Y5Q1_9LEPT|nr:M23 family metallopeptidase [Leptospira santarosai]EKT88734.1 peptidase M23 [Leptospira santarosai serovar Shermani str. LT 821]EPG83164.1 peptidase, M23 family [Leptospira santarosai serovar Shermani str. 1342KT]MDI7190886.1 M23 family metallopeptidase [Leptospira santarosai]MDI7214150.1 M23 family metallopeptidase [Leptospira santarosai]MDI7220983.1 M23 family metallopeptidase [Leptospira santarosai]